MPRSRERASEQLGSLLQDGLPDLREELVLRRATQVPGGELGVEGMEDLVVEGRLLQGRDDVQSFGPGAGGFDVWHQ